MDEPYEDPPLDDWWTSGALRSAWTTFRTRAGAVRVYVRRNAFDHSVMEIASISNIEGFGGIRALYRDYCRDIPALAENILNPQLDALLARLGWEQVYYDLGGTPTRVNRAFCDRFPRHAEAKSAMQAIMANRKLVD